jgi:hypothetical protein
VNCRRRFPTANETIAHQPKNRNLRQRKHEIVSGTDLDCQTKKKKKTVSFDSKLEWGGRSAPNGVLVAARRHKIGLNGHQPPFRRWTQSNVGHLPVCQSHSVTEECGTTSFNGSFFHSAMSKRPAPSAVIRPDSSEEEVVEFILTALPSAWPPAAAAAETARGLSPTVLLACRFLFSLQPFPFNHLRHWHK